MGQDTILNCESEDKINMEDKYVGGGGGGSEQ